jgi:hypothetical protein
MANGGPNVGQRIAANWEAVVKTKPEDQIHDDYWLFNQLSEGSGFVGKSGGDFITVPIEYSLNGAVGSYSDTDTISTTRYDVFDRYEAQWKEYYGTYVISDLESDRNAGEGQVFDLRAGKLENLKNSIKSTFNADFYAAGTANSSKTFTGLATLVSSAPTSGTVQGVDRGSFTWARNQQTTGTQTTSAFDNLRAAMRTNYNLCSNGVSSEHPSFAVTTRTVFEGFEGLLLANERFTDKSSGDGSFKNEVLKFKGAKISYDNDCTSGVLYFLNPKFLKLYYKTGAWMKAQEPIRPANQTLDVIVIRTMANLVALNPRRLGAVTAIT